MNYLPERDQFRNRDRIKRFANIRRPAASTNVTALFIDVHQRLRNVTASCIDVQQRLRTSSHYLLASSSVYERRILIYWRPAASTNFTTLFIDVQQRLRISQPCLLTSSSVYERHILIFDVQQRLRTSQPHLLTSSSVMETSYTNEYERHILIW